MWLMGHIFIFSVESNLKYTFLTLHCVGVNEDEERHNLEPGFCCFGFCLIKKKSDAQGKKNTSQD